MSNDDAIKLAVKSLLEVVQTGAKNIDLAVMEGFGKVRVSGDTTSGETELPAEHTSRFQLAESHTRRDRGRR